MSYSRGKEATAVMETKTVIFPFPRGKIRFCGD